MANLYVYPEDLRLLAKETEGWLSFHIVRNVEYVKMDARKECRRFISIILKRRGIKQKILIHNVEFSFNYECPAV